MSGIEVCRGCLQTQGPLLSLLGTTLGGYYETIIDRRITHYDGLPLWLCSVCAALTKRIFAFQQQCYATESLLVQYKSTYGQLSETLITSIDPKTIPLALNLTSPPPQIHDSLSPITPLIVKNEDYRETLPLESDDFMSEVFGNEDSDDEVKPLAFIRREEVKFENLDEDSKEQDTIKTESKKKKSKKKLTKKSKTERVKKEEKKRDTTRKTRKKSEGEITVKDVEKFATLRIMTHEEQVAEVMKRKDSSNYKNNPFKCDLCYKGFVDPTTYKNHMQRHSPVNGDFECAVCRVRRTTAYRLRGHVKAVHSRQYTCRACQFVSSNANQALEHEKWHRGVKHQCQFCDKTFSKWSSRLSHERLRHRSQFVCRACGDAFVSELGLVQHRSRAHRTEESANAEPTDGDTQNEHYCSDCDLNFSTSEAYIRHTLTSVKHGHHDSNVNGCVSCGAVFATEAERLQHARHHAARCGHFRKRLSVSPRIGNVQCGECNEEFRAASHCMAHYKSHHPGVQYPAEFVCETCGRKCKNRAVLLYHQRTHTGERPYPCNVCGAAFKHQSNLRRHSRVHTGEKLFECEICLKRFTQKVGKDLHVQYVHEKVPYPRRNRTRHGDRDT